LQLFCPKFRMFVMRPTRLSHLIIVDFINNESSHYAVFSSHCAATAARYKHSASHNHWLSVTTSTWCASKRAVCGSQGVLIGRRHGAWQDGDDMVGGSGPCGYLWRPSRSDQGLGRRILLGGARSSQQTRDTPGECHTLTLVQCLNIRPTTSQKTRLTMSQILTGVSGNKHDA
jgi:hypothetical protein